MAQTIEPDDFSDAVSSILNQYGDECRLTLKEAVQTVMKKAVKSLKSSSSGAFKDRTGQYRKGWKSKVEETRLSVDGVAFNGKMPGLTHLLEFGHAKAGGGRVQGFPHISDVNDQTAESFEKELRSKL